MSVYNPQEFDNISRVVETYRKELEMFDYHSIYAMNETEFERFYSFVLDIFKKHFPTFTDGMIGYLVNPDSINDTGYRNINISIANRYLLLFKDFKRGREYDPDVEIRLTPYPVEGEATYPILWTNVIGVENDTEYGHNFFDPNESGD